MIDIVGKAKFRGFRDSETADMFNLEYDLVPDPTFLIDIGNYVNVSVPFEKIELNDGRHHYQKNLNPLEWFHSFSMFSYVITDRMHPSVACLKYGTNFHTKDKRFKTKEVIKTFDLKNFEQSFRHGAFNVVSIITGTGYTSDNYNLWGPFPIYLLFFGMFVGGCAGSTTCGIKVFRFQILFETLKMQIQKLLHPHGVFVPHYNHRKIQDEVTSSVMSFFFIFILSFITITLLLSMTELDFVTSLSAAATSLANVGPGLGATIGPENSFYAVSDPAKWILIFSMLLGRLEILTVLVIFHPAFWKK